MRLPLVLLVLCPLWAGCSFATSGLTEDDKANLTPAAMVYALQGEFNIILRAVAAYNSQPRCAAAVVVGCSEQAIMDRVRPMILRAKLALDDAASTVKANPGAQVALVAASALRILIAQLSAYVVAQQIQVKT